MVREAVTGRRFSRWRERTFSPEDDIEELVAELSKNEPSVAQIAQETKRATKFLARRGLPIQTRLALSRSQGWSINVEEVKLMEDVADVAPLDEYMLRHAGYVRDSSQHMAARWIVLANEWPGASGERAAWIVFWLGQIDVLTDVYSSEIYGITNARKQRAENQGLPSGSFRACLWAIRPRSWRKNGTVHDLGLAPGARRTRTPCTSQRPRRGAVLGDDESRRQASSGRVHQENSGRELGIFVTIDSPNLISRNKRETEGG